MALLLRSVICTMRYAKGTTGQYHEYCQLFLIACESPMAKYKCKMHLVNVKCTRHLFACAHAMAYRTRKICISGTVCFIICNVRISDYAWIYRKLWIVEWKKLIKINLPRWKTIIEIFHIRNMSVRNEWMSGLTLATRHIAKCENKTHVAKEMSNNLVTLAKKCKMFFWRSRYLVGMFPTSSQLIFCIFQ